MARAFNSQDVKELTVTAPGAEEPIHPANEEEIRGAGQEEAQRFLAALAGSGCVTFQTFDDTPAKRQRLAKVLHGRFDEHAGRLRQLNTEGAGIFVMVNQGDGRARRQENVQTVRALFVDLDGAPLGPVLQAPIAPHIVVESSPQRWHAYWLVDGVPLEHFSYLQSQLANMFDGDPAVKDLPRVMRLPGFFHQKNGAHRSRLLHLRDGEHIAYDAFMKAFGFLPPVNVGERNARLFDAASGFRQKGIPKQAALQRIAKINASACEEPLDLREVEAVVNNAYQYAALGFSIVPHAVVDTPEFDQLSAGAVKVLVYALRRHRPGQTFALPYSEFKHIRDLTNRKSFRAAIEELLGAKFLVMTRDYVAGAEAEHRLCALYRIADRVQIVPKQQGR